MLIDVNWIRLEIEHTPNAPNHFHQAVAARKDDSHRHACAIRFMPHLDRASAAINLNRSSIRMSINRFYPGGGSSLEKFVQRTPIERGAIWKMYDDSSVAPCCLGNPVQRTNFGGGLPESCSYGVVELANTLETGA
jgi:hypothetical protein